MLSQFLMLNYLRIICVVTFYWLVSIITVFINKKLLSAKDINLDAPFFIIWFQCFTTVLICILIRSLSHMFPSLFKFPKSSPFNYDVMKTVLPLSILFTSMIGFNTLCLKHVGISFYYIGRSLTTVFSVVFTFCVLKEKVSCQTIACCTLIVAGFWLGVDQEGVLGTLSVGGTFFGVLASVSLALYSIQTKKVLPFVNNHIWLLTYYNNIYSCILLLPLILFTKEIHNVLGYSNLKDGYFWSLMILGGICGFSIGYATSLQIQVTSPLTHNVSGTAKACAQTVIATFVFAENKTWFWWFSNFMVLFGSAAYTSVKQTEMKMKYLESRTLRI